METPSLADLLKQGRFTAAAAERLQRIARMTLDGRPLDTFPYRLPQSERESEVPEAAVFVAAPAFVAGGFERADFYRTADAGTGLRATVRTGEIAVVVRVARAGEALDVNALLNDAVDADPKVWPRDAFVSVTFDPNVAPHAEPADPQTLVDEFLALLRGDRYALFRSNDRLRAEDGFPTFARFGAWINAYPLPGRERGLVVINGTSEAPLQGRRSASIEDALTSARAAGSATPERPVWLAILVGRIPPAPLDALDAIAAAPFERVWITDGSEARPLGPAGG